MQGSQITSSSRPNTDIPLSNYLEETNASEGPSVSTIGQECVTDICDNLVQIDKNEAINEEVKKVVSDNIVLDMKPEKKAETVVLNAKISKVEDTGKGAMAAWHAISKGTAGNKSVVDIKKEEELTDQVICDGNSLPLDAESRLPFFLLDAHEEPYGANPGIIYMFGKVCIHAETLQL